SPVQQHAVLVGQRHDLQALPRRGHDEEHPSRAAVCRCRVGKERLKVLKRAEVPFLTWPPPLLRTPVRIASGTWSRRCSSSSIVSSASSGYGSSALFRLST